MDENGWTNLENQLNRKTDRNRKAYARHRAKKIFVIIFMQLMLFVAALTILYLGMSERINRMTSVFCGGFFACAMTFFAGYLIGGRKI